MEKYLWYFIFKKNIFLLTIAYLRNDYNGEE